MSIHFTSVLTGIFFGIIFLVILLLLLNNGSRVRRLGTTFIWFCLGLTVIRLVVPIEFPFTISIYIYDVLPDIYRFYRFTLFEIGGFSFKVAHLFGAIWGIGIIVIGYVQVKRQLEFHRILRISPLIHDHETLQLLDSLKEKYHIQRNFSLVNVPGIDTPAITGYFHPYVFLPKVPYSKQQLNLILSHELFHYLHKDYLINYLFELLTILFWWNPIFYLLKNIYRQIAEYSVDARISKEMSPEEKLDYQECLIYTAQYAAHKRWLPVSALAPWKKKTLKKRLDFLNLSGSNSKYSTPISYLRVTVMLLLFLSFFVIFEPATPLKENTLDNFGLSAIEYIEKTDDGYYIYIQGNTTPGFLYDLPPELESFLLN